MILWKTLKTKEMVRTLPPFQSLQGQLIISAQNEAGQFFNKSVILITKHTEQGGATGFVLNHPLTHLTPREVFKERDISCLGDDFHIYQGGPVDLGHGAVLHTDDYHALDSQDLFHHLLLTETQQVLDDISEGTGPKDFIVFVGKSVWERGQLEEELMGNMWILAPLHLDLIFHTPDNKKWQEALATLGIDANLLISEAGKA